MKQTLQFQVSLYKVAQVICMCIHISKSNALKTLFKLPLKMTSCIMIVVEQVPLLSGGCPQYSTDNVQDSVPAIIDL